MTSRYLDMCLQAWRAWPRSRCPGPGCWRPRTSPGTSWPAAGSTRPRRWPSWTSRSVPAASAVRSTAALTLSCSGTSAPATPRSCSGCRARARSRSRWTLGPGRGTTCSGAGSRCGHVASYTCCVLWHVVPWQVRHVYRNTTAGEAGDTVYRVQQVTRALLTLPRATCCCQVVRVLRPSVHLSGSYTCKVATFYTELRSSHTLIIYGECHVSRVTCVTCPGCCRPRAGPLAALRDGAARDGGAVPRAAGLPRAAPRHLGLHGAVVPRRGARAHHHHAAPRADVRRGGEHEPRHGRALAADCVLLHHGDTRHPVHPEGGHHVQHRGHQVLI